MPNIKLASNATNLFVYLLRPVFGFVLACSYPNEERTRIYVQYFQTRISVIFFTSVLMLTIPVNVGKSLDKAKHLKD